MSALPTRRSRGETTNTNTQTGYKVFPADQRKLQQIRDTKEQQRTPKNSPSRPTTTTNNYYQRTLSFTLATTTNTRPQLELIGILQTSPDITHIPCSPLLKDDITSPPHTGGITNPRSTTLQSLNSPHILTTT